MKTIYAIRDRIADDIAGNNHALVIFKSEPQAVRYFGDILAAKDTALSQHPNDYELIACGTIDDDGTIQHALSPRIIITGTALTELQQPPAEPTHEQILQFQREA